MLVVVETVDIGVEPHLASAEGGVAVALQSDAVDGVAREEVSLRRTPLDEYGGKVLVEEDAPFLFLRGVEGDLYYLRLAVGVGSEIDDARSGRALREVVLTVAGDAGDIEALDEVVALLSVAQQEY